MSSPPNNIHFSLQDISSDLEETEEDNAFTNYAVNFLQDIVNENRYIRVEPDVDAGILSVIQNYESTCNVKDIVKIAEYYGIQKQLGKLKKLEMIYMIALFENDGKNSDIVLKRKQLWVYMEELKQDKFMRRFVVW